MSHDVHALVEQFMPYANKLAHERKKSLPRFIDFEEIQSAAYLGLVEAANRYCPERGVDFRTFSFPRIRGAITDYLRSLGRQLVSIDAQNDSGVALNETLEALDAVDKSEETLDEVSKGLGDRARAMLKYYYLDDFSLKEVGERFGVTESRVCQLLAGYKDKIREQMEFADVAA